MEKVKELLKELDDDYLEYIFIRSGVNVLSDALKNRQRNRDLNDLELQLYRIVQ